MSCYAQDCREPPKHELLSFPMCTPHYIEALEHSAHIVSTPVGVLIIEDKRREEERLAPARRRLEKPLLEKAARKAATGKSAGFSPDPAASVNGRKRDGRISRKAFLRLGRRFSRLLFVSSRLTPQSTPIHRRPVQRFSGTPSAAAGCGGEQS